MWCLLLNRIDAINNKNHYLRIKWEYDGMGAFVLISRGIYAESNFQSKRVMQVAAQVAID